MKGAGNTSQPQGSARKSTISAHMPRIPHDCRMWIDQPARPWTQHRLCVGAARRSKRGLHRQSAVRKADRDDPVMAGELILVVDDDPDIVEVLRCLLHDAGYEVATADDGAALPLARARQPRAILLDILMPSMDGVEISRRLRADPATAHIPIIAMSATPQWLPALPVNDRLTKPFKL